MKAVIYNNYGGPDVLQLVEIEKPVPKAGEVLVAVHAASINPADRHFVRGLAMVRPLLGLRKPRNPRVGIDVAGVVESVGASVKELKSGDAVFGSAHGSLAEYVCVPEADLVLKPASVTFEDAASVNIAALTALQGLRDKGRVQPGQQILINGAAGGVGTFAVQIGKYLGAHVTGVCSTRNVEMVRSISADEVIDYTRDDFTKSGRQYDLIFDCAGNHDLRAYRRALKPSGTCVMVGGPVNSTIGMLAGLFAIFGYAAIVKERFVVLLAKKSTTDLTTIGELIASGTIKPVIDRQYALTEIRDAFRHLGEGHARGKIIIMPRRP